MPRTLTLTVVVLATATLLVTGSGTAVEPGTHPDVDDSVTCDGCHREATPSVVDEWFAGAHGKNNVKCFVCHGPTGAEFVRVPDALRCVGCHAEQITADPDPSAARCFSCHPPHLLSPHAAPATTTEGGQP